MTNNSTESNKNPDSGFNNNNMTTDTPRTDSIEFRHCPPQPEAMLKKHEDAYALSRELELEMLTARNRAFNLANALSKAEADVERLTTLMHQTIWFVDDMIKTHTKGCEHCLKKHGAMIALFKDITIEPQWSIDPTDK